MRRINYGAAKAKATDTGQGGTKQNGGRALTQPPCSLQGRSCCSRCSSPSPCTVPQVRHLVGCRSGLGVPTGGVPLGRSGKETPAGSGADAAGRRSNTLVEAGWRRMEMVLGGLSKATPGEMLRELGGDSGSRSPGLSWMSKWGVVGGWSVVSFLEPSKTPRKLCPRLGTPPKTSSPNGAPRPHPALGQLQRRGVPGPTPFPSTPLSAFPSPALAAMNHDPINP